MKFEITDEADDDLQDMDKFTQEKFIKHMRKITGILPTRFFKNHNVEQVGEQGRIIFQIDREKSVVYILRCFTRHKDYEKWCNSFR